VPAKDDVQLPVVSLDILQMHLAMGDSLDIYADFNEQELLVSLPGTGAPQLSSALGLLMCAFVAEPSEAAQMLPRCALVVGRGC
jgi:hypothetical protein